MAHQHHDATPVPPELRWLWLAVSCRQLPCAQHADMVHQVLLAKAKNEAEDAQRLLLGALNGLAALMLVDARPADAVALYRQVIHVCSLPCCAMRSRSKQGCTESMGP